MKKKLRILKKALSIFTSFNLILQVIFGSLFLNPHFVFGQEAPTATPIPEVTIVPEITTEPASVSPLSPTSAPEAIAPTSEPTAPTSEPTIELTQIPTSQPSVEPSLGPTLVPTDELSPELTVEPTAVPTPEPTLSLESTPTTALVEKECLGNGAEIKETTNEDWNIVSEKVFAETKEKVKLGVRYVFPLENKVTVTFKCLPKDEGVRSSLKIEQIKVSDLKLPEGVSPADDFAYDITTSMPDGTFEYDVSLPKPENKTAEVSFIEKSAEEIKSENRSLNADDLKKIEEGKITQEGGTIKISSLDHFTIFLVTGGKDTTHLLIPVSLDASLSELSTSDDIRYETKGSWPSSWNWPYQQNQYLEFTFSPNIPSSAVINSVKIIFEYQRDPIVAGSEIDARMRAWDGTGFNVEIADYSDLGLATYNVDETKEISVPLELVNTSEKANNFKFRFYLRGQGLDCCCFKTRHDLVSLDIDYTLSGPTTTSTPTPDGTITSTSTPTPTEMLTPTNTPTPDGTITSTPTPTQTETPTPTVTPPSNCGDGIKTEEEECDGQDGVSEGQNFCTPTCKLIPIYDGSHECSSTKVPVSVPEMTGIQISGTNQEPISLLTHAGQEYLFEITGTYGYGGSPKNNEMNRSDAGYATENNWGSVRSDLGIGSGAAFRGVGSILSDMGTGKMGIVDWGDYQSNHIYRKAYTSSSETKFVISDWYDEWYNESPHNINNNQLGMGDNEGGLTLNVYECRVPTATVGDTVWKDTNDNNVQDEGEQGISGAKVETYRDSNGNNSFDEGIDTLVAWQNTQDNGHYLFNELEAGTYFVRVDESTVPSGYTVSAGGSNPRGPIALAAGQIDLDEDFGFAPPVAISLVKHNDKEAGASVGEIVTYTLTIFVGGERTLSSMALVDNLPEGFIYQTGTSKIGEARVEPTLSNNGKTLAWDWGSVLSGSTITIVYQTKIDSANQAASYTNYAWAYGYGSPTKVESEIVESIVPIGPVYSYSTQAGGTVLGVADEKVLGAVLPAAGANTNLLLLALGLINTGLALKSQKKRKAN